MACRPLFSSGNALSVPIGVVGLGMGLGHQWPTGPLDILKKLHPKGPRGEEEMSSANQALATGPCHCGGISWGLVSLELLIVSDSICRREKGLGKRLSSREEDWQVFGPCK